MVVTEPYSRFTYYRLRPGPLFELADEVTSLANAAQTGQGRKRSR